MFDLLGNSDDGHFSAEEFAAIPALPLDMTIADAIRFLAEEYQLGGWRPWPKERAREAVIRVAPIAFPKQVIGEKDVFRPTTFVAELPARGRLVLALLLRDLMLPGIRGELPEPTETTAKPARVKKGGQ